MWIEEADGALTSAFVYGPDRARIKQTSYVGATATRTVIYAGGGFERHITPGAPDELVHYIGGAVAVFTRTDDANPATDKTRYLHKDHLGSVVMVTDEAGLVAETRSHDAWGGPRNPDWTVPAVTPFLTETARGFTGHEHLQTVGLIHMNGRVYDPKIGRMLSADPFVPDPVDTQSFNRYSYVINNPLSFTDPSGFHPGSSSHDYDSEDQKANNDYPGGGDNTGGYDGNPRGDNPEGGGGEGGYGGGTGSGPGNAAAFNGSVLNGAATGGPGTQGLSLNAPGGIVKSSGISLSAGAFGDALTNLLSKATALALDLVGKAWASPMTVLGFAYVGIDYVLGLWAGNKPEFRFDHNAIELIGGGIQTKTGGAITLGNVISYSLSNPPTDTTSYGQANVITGLHEEAHTYQYQVLGPLFVPVYLVLGGFSGLSNPLEKQANIYGDLTSLGWKQSWWPK